MQRILHVAILLGVILAFFPSLVYSLSANEEALKKRATEYLNSLASLAGSDNEKK